jgi:hypothetical protein
MRSTRCSTTGSGTPERYRTDRGPEFRVGQRSRQPRRQARQLDRLRCSEGGGERHSSREHADRHHDQVPHRRRPRYGRADQRRGARRAGDLAPESDGRTGHRRAANPAGRQFPRRGQSGRDIDLRVSIMPSIHGEDVVVRILDKRGVIEAHGSLTLGSLGFDEHALKALRRLAEEPYGMLLVTGPTGSGKTTTLYAAISEINNTATRSSPSKTRLSTSCPASCRFRSTTRRA